MQNKKIRIGCGQGFWGDWLEAPKKLVESGNLDYLILDYLAEVTMSILAKQFERDPSLGYAKDFPLLIAKLAPDVVSKNLKIIANAGGLNPKACALKAIEEIKKVHPNLPTPKIAIVTGDNLISSLDELKNLGVDFKNTDTNENFSSISGQIKSVNAYIGSEPIIKALEQGAQIIITGRVADPSMCLAPAAYEYNWLLNDWDKLASGIVAGHIIECGPQSTGGNYSFDWESVSDLWDVGYPIIEFSSSGDFVVTKPKNSGGLVSVQSVTEQLVYEISDPKSYITPDVIVDFTTLNLKQIAVHQVLVTNIKGKKRPDTLKISATYHSGYTAEGTLIVTGQNALSKSKKIKDIIEKRLSMINLNFDEIIFENLGAFSCIPGIESMFSDLEYPEIVFRVAVKDCDKKKVDRFTREIAPLVLSGPPGITGYAGGKREVKEIFSFWPSLIDRNHIKTKVELI